jgi:hypothetical protein
MPRLTLIALLFLICFLPACKKALSSHERWEFSFDYKGRTYTNPDYGSPVEYNGEVIGIDIRKPDVFGGILRFLWINNCAYIIPAGTDIFYNDNNCQYYSNSPIDSSRLYTYQSGGKQNYTISNCEQKKDPFAGAIYETCTISGSFSLVLVNKAGSTISINGKYKNPGVVR